MSEFLTVDDMGRLSQVNKKYYELLKKDVYWKDQYNRNWKKSKLNLRNNATFKEKCVAAYSQVYHPP